MKFAYLYRTSDNAKQSGELDARSRDDAYQTLKARGIRPMKVWPLEKPRNWKPLYVALGLGLALGAAIAVMRVRQQSKFATTEARKQLYGDATTIEQGVRGDWANVLDDAGDRLLALYAQPGRKVEPRTATRTADLAALKSALAHRLAYTELDTAEHRQLKRIVEWMKEEARGVVAAGGTLEGYLAALDERQRREIEIYDQTAAEFEKERVGKDAERLYALWMRKNAALKSMGIRLLPSPEGLEDD